MAKGTPQHACDNCGQSCTGYTWTELHADGWRKHGEGTFIMCGECEQTFAERREAAGLANA